MSGTNAGPASAEEVTIRMYKHLLGDCFLLRLRDGRRRSHILIDCGVLWGVEKGAQRMRAVADDILRETGYEPTKGTRARIDLLVLTHEHWDHLSGFSHAPDLLDASKVDIGQLWLAWTENTGDPQAKTLRDRFAKDRELVRLFVDPKRSPGSPFAAAPDKVIEGLQAFLGPEGFGVATLHLKTHQIIEQARKLAKQVRYLEPGEVLPTPGPVPLRTYVLGPPRDEKRLFKDSPSAGADKETYFANPREDLSANTAMNRLALSTLAASSPTSAAQAEDRAALSPFPPRHHGLTGEEVRAATGTLPQQSARHSLAWWFNQRYVADKAPCRYDDAPDQAPAKHNCKTDQLCNATQAHRRIDGDWMAVAGPLALKLDSDTNNTSLVLAFELRDRQVLLFAADAQVGNWLSWHDRVYDGVTAADLLARTTVYKVGHHGSHNATLRTHGLEMMTNDSLVALLSTDEEAARSQGRHGWRMPWPDLAEALRRRTAGRLISGDAQKGHDLDGSVLTRDTAFLDRVVEGPKDLWVEYRAGGDRRIG